MNYTIPICIYLFQNFQGFVGNGDCQYHWKCTDDGKCGKSDLIESTKAAHAKDCNFKCGQTTACTAFAFWSSGATCEKYRGGPYTYGSGHLGAVCHTYQGWRNFKFLLFGT